MFRENLRLHLLTPMIRDDNIWDPDTVSHLRRSLNLKILAAELCIGFDMAVGRSELSVGAGEVQGWVCDGGDGDGDGCQVGPHMCPPPPPHDGAKSDD